MINRDLVRFAGLSGSKVTQLCIPGPGYLKSEIVFLDPFQSETDRLFGNVFLKY